jgi:hypothetical protein
MVSTKGCASGCCNLNTWNYEHEKPFKELVAYETSEHLAERLLELTPSDGAAISPRTRTRRLARSWAAGERTGLIRYNSGNPINGINAVTTVGHAGGRTVARPLVE